ncbi:MAG: transglycosylase domain-containing protein, partial [Acidimicrobiales bacterium]|nr:transglycosylase domain-containing protein [Acidimicrobiales bacterium]
MARTRKPVPVHNLKVTRAGKVKKRWVFWRMRRVFYLAALALTVGIAGVIYVLGRVELPVDPRVAPVEAQTTFICSADVVTNCNASNSMAQLHGVEDRVLVTYDQIPEVLQQAVLSAEDKDFFTHDGVDPMGIARAAYRDLRNEGVRQGGSTITQQYVKQTYLSSEQTATRKIKEAVMAVKLEQQISKEEILTRYLNTVYFGRGAYGVQAASRVWFDHDISALDAGEAAFLAGLLRSPNGADPYRDADGLAEAQRRRASVLDNMVAEGYLTPEERDVLVAVPLDPNDPDVGEGEVMIVPPPTPSVLGEDVKGAEWGSEYFAEYVRLWLIDEFGSDAVQTGGLRVYTTLDLDMQKAAYDAVTTTLNQEGDPAGALVALDDGGHIKAMMGGTDYANSEFNLAVNGQGRQPGSTFKMFALADAVRRNYSIQSVLPSPP